MSMMFTLPYIRLHSGLLQEQKNMRPVDIEADVKEMERRKRVEAIMQSKLFREELERVVGDSLRDSGADSIAGLISDVMNIKSGSKCPSRLLIKHLKSFNMDIEYFRQHLYFKSFFSFKPCCQPI